MKKEKTVKRNKVKKMSISEIRAKLAELEKRNDKSIYRIHLQEELKRRKGQL